MPFIPKVWKNKNQGVPYTYVTAEELNRIEQGIADAAQSGGGASDFPASTGIVYDGAGNVQSVTEDGITTTYTYNPDGSVATDTRSGVTRTYTYDGSGNLTGIAS